jgi:hypothetical protein
MVHDTRQTSGTGGSRPAGQNEKGSDSAAAWSAYRRMLRLTAVVAMLAASAALAWLTADGAPLRWELWAAVAGGVGGTVLLSGALMGLAFLSARSGHDASIEDPHDPAG